MDTVYFLEVLYPLQDRVLQAIRGSETEFHLSGGTALSRGYLNHRYSDDLDFFLNDDDHFRLYADRVTHALTQIPDWDLQVLLREERFVRLTLARESIALKIEMINDVPSRIGTPWQHPTLGLIDTAENILANKITAVLDRAAPKDLADIWGLCCLKGLMIADAVTGAQGKAAGVFPADLARVLCSATRSDWEQVRWTDPPEPDHYLRDLREIGERLLIPGTSADAK